MVLHPMELILIVQRKIQIAQFLAIFSAFLRFIYLIFMTYFMIYNKGA